MCGVQATPQGYPQTSRCLSVVLVSEMLKRSVEEEDCTMYSVHSGGAFAWTWTLCVICEYHVGVTTLED